MEHNTSAINKKILLVGAEGVGKSTWINRILNGEFKRDLYPTIGAEGYILNHKQYDYQDENFRFYIIDCSGSDDVFYKGLGIKGYTRSIDALILMADVTKPDTYKYWSLTAVKEIIIENPDIVVIKCATKGDRINQTYKKKIPDGTILISSKSNYNLYKPLDQIRDAFTKG